MNLSDNKNFVIVIPSFNNEKWAEQNIISALNQNYENYRILFIDDCSIDNTADIVRNIVVNHQNKNKCQMIRNFERKGSLHNIYDAVHSCDDDEIIAMLDGDDWLADNEVLSFLNKEYTENDLWMTYGQYQDYPHGRWCATKIPDEVINNNTVRYFPFGASHLKTFHSWLFKKIKKEDLLFEGNFLPMAGDVAFMTPMLEMSGNKSKFIDKILYIYNSANPINDHAVNRNLQVEMDFLIKSRPRYQNLLNPGYKLNVVDNGAWNWLKLDLYLDKSVFISVDKLVSDPNSEINIFLQVEPMGVAKACHGYDYQDIIQNHKKWDFIFAWDEELLKLPNASIFEYGHAWLDGYQKLIEKNSLCSMICGDKAWMPGHIKRIDTFRALINNNDVKKFYSKDSSWKKFEHIPNCFELEVNNVKRIDAFRSQFHVAVENCSENNYFSEKLLDCFLTSTIPIYWGCPNISKYFNAKGMIFLKDFDNVDELINHIKSIDIYTMLPYIEDNYKRALIWGNLNSRLTSKILQVLGN